MSSMSISIVNYAGWKRLQQAGGTPTPTTVIVTPDTFAIDTLETQQLTATVLDQAGNPMTGQTVTWESSDEGVATVDSSGLVTPVSAGTVTITAMCGAASDTSAGTITAHVYFEDNLDRANSATTMGPAYNIAGALTWGIQSNRAYAPTVNAFGMATHDCGAADIDYTVDVELKSVADNSRGQAVFRSDGTTDNRWAVGVDGLFTKLQLVKIVAGTATTVHEPSFSATPGTVYTIRMVAKAGAITVYVNGVSTLTGTDDTPLATLTSHGIAASRKTSASGSPKFDNIRVLHAG